MFSPDLTAVVCVVFLLFGRSQGGPSNENDSFRNLVEMFSVDARRLAFYTVLTVVVLHLVWCAGFCIFVFFALVAVSVAWPKIALL